MVGIDFADKLSTSPRSFAFLIIAKKTTMIIFQADALYKRDGGNLTQYPHIA